VNPLRYCPGNPNNRQQMAVFLQKTFNLQWPRPLASAIRVTAESDAVLWTASSSALPTAGGLPSVVGSCKRLSTCS